MDRSKAGKPQRPRFTEHHKRQLAKINQNIPLRDALLHISASRRMLGMVTEKLRNTDELLSQQEYIDLDIAECLLSLQTLTEILLSSEEHLKEYMQKRTSQRE